MLRSIRSILQVYQVHVTYLCPQDAYVHQKIAVQLTLEVT